MRTAIIGPQLKWTFSSLRRHRSLWLDFFFFTFLLRRCVFVKLKASLDSEVTTKLLVPARFASDLSGWPY